MCRAILKFIFLSQVLLLIFLSSVGCLQIPSTKLKYVCSNFPFCSQDQKTGEWKNIVGFPVFPGTIHDNKAMVVKAEIGQGRVIGAGASSCLTKGSYCLYNSSSLITQLEVESFNVCQEKCKNTRTCTLFSFHRRWGRGSCALLTSCPSTFSCGQEEFCAIGTSAGCQCPKLEYQLGGEASVVNSKWNCIGIDPYKSSIPPGTSCSVTCPSWGGTYLSSTCLPSGQWSQSVSNQARSSASAYSAPFPTPVDQPVFQCGCPDLGPFMYNPNTEPNTKFQCDNWPESKVEYLKNSKKHSLSFLNYFSSTDIW